jgi:ribonuclease D
MNDLQPGESVEVPGSGNQTYVLRNTNGDYSCTCMAWKRQRIPSAQRTCKHLKRFRGEQTELDRTAVSAPPPMPDIVLPNVINEPQAIRHAIERLAQCERLWLDTEIADSQRGPGRLSLIQALPDHAEPNPVACVILDVMDQPDLIDLFINRIMKEESVEKVFHKASFDTAYLGGSAAVNVFCTLRMAQALPSYRFPFPRGCSLKVLTEQFGIADSVSKHEQQSDWGIRPLTNDQICYAALDVVYLRGVHLQLMQLTSQLEDPAKVSIDEIASRLLPLEDQCQRLESEQNYLRGLLKKAMAIQGIERTKDYELSHRVAPMNVPLSELVNLLNKSGLTIDTPIRLNKEILEAMGDLAARLKSVAPTSDELFLKRRAD